MEGYVIEDAVDIDSITGIVEKLLARAPELEPKGGPPIKFLNHDPSSPSMFGGWFGQRRAPVTFLQAPSQELATYLCGDPLGPFRSPGELGSQSTHERWGFRMDRLEGLLKADWHTVPQLGPEAEVFLPRLGRAGRLLRAPPRILAFVAAFRAVNRPSWAAMAEVLRGLGRAGSEGRGGAGGARGRVLRALAECIANERHFGAVEAQVWWGDPAKRLPSHKDGAPSLLHLGVTLGGRRTLRAGVFRGRHAEGNRPPLPLLAPAGAVMPQKPASPWASAGVPEGLVPLGANFGARPVDPAGSGEKNVWDEVLWRKEHLRELPMATGSVYLSSPFCFEHAVCYEACSDREPVIALQCRFGFPEDLGAKLNDLRDQEMLGAATVVAEALRAACAGGLLRLPSVSEVVQAEVDLRTKRPELAH